MSISQKSLIVKASTIPGSGKGLFTKKLIPAGTRIIEYTGKVTTWKEADNDDGENAYIYYVKRNYVIDARPHKKSLARYANDARGLNKIKGINNNCEYVEEGNRVFIYSKKEIAAGSELFVPYGPEYWQVIRHNYKINLQNKKAEEAAKAKAAKTSKVKTKQKDQLKAVKPAEKKSTVRKSVTTGSAKSAKAKPKAPKRIASAPKGNLEAA
ncbi:MAG: SET domain-containing protein [Flavitalea sp.]